MFMKNRSKSNCVSPLLYIDQPYMKTPKSKMQKSYKFRETPEPIIVEIPMDLENNDKNLEDQGVSGKKEQKGKKNINEKENQEKLSQLEEIAKKSLENKNNKPENSNQDNEKLSPEESQPGNEKQSVLKREKALSQKRVPFNELKLEEKLKNLRMVPAAMAKIRFEFITSEGGTPGYFLSSKGDVIHILKIESNETIPLPLHSIKDIRMIGI
jgi:hypothetical protein